MSPRAIDFLIGSDLKEVLVAIEEGKRNYSTIILDKAIERLECYLQHEAVRKLKIIKEAILDTKISDDAVHFTIINTFDNMG